MDRQDITIVSLWLHVPFVITWFGLIMMDAFALFAPGLNNDQRTRMLQWSRLFVLVAIPVIMITGIWQTMENPFFRVDSYARLERLRHRTLYGELLFFKHGLVIATFGLTILVRFILAPRLRAGLATAGGAVVEAAPGTLHLIRTASLVNLAACLGAIMLATRMVMELH